MIRTQRLRASKTLRHLVCETVLTLDDFVLPVFVRHGQGQKIPIASLPGHYQWSVDQLPNLIRQIEDSGVGSVLLFGIPEQKDALGSSSMAQDGVVQRALNVFKTCSKLLTIADVCLCAYTDHGHCGIIDARENESQARQKSDVVHLNNDETLPLLAKQAISLAKAGADVVAPSGMMDGIVGTMRKALDAEGFSRVPILSYSVKYSSALYGPFREAAKGAPQFGDRRTYQMDPANGREALREAQLDVSEQADVVMVKPAGFYLDVIRSVKQRYPEMPLAAYQVSGEYAMLKAAAEKGWVDERCAALESLIAIKRAGADIIITYYAKALAQWL